MKIGDKVRFLTETGGGVVAGFQGKKMLTDFRFPHPSTKWWSLDKKTTA